MLEPAPHISSDQWSVPECAEHGSEYVVADSQYESGVKCFACLEKEEAENE